MPKEPLAYILRPTSLEDFYGQDHLVGKDSLLRKMIESDKLASMIFFGPSGTGKTTLASIISNMTNAQFIKVDATSAGVKDIRSAITQAQIEYDMKERKTILFVDEVHRHSKNVQDVLLPAVEDGTIILIGATTENPYFAINGPIISRSHIFEFNSLNSKDMARAIIRAVNYYEENGIKVKVEKEASKYLITMCNGDVRKLLLAIEFAVEIYSENGLVTLDREMCKKVMPHKSILFDKSGEEHYDLMSAIQGAIQASDVDGALFYLGKAINMGEDLEKICRRLLVTASEDVGCCNPIAAIHTYSCVKSAIIVGFPEAQIILSSAVAYLAMNPRSKAACKAISKARRLDNEGSIVIPQFLKDCHYAGAKKLGRGSYQDGHNMDDYVRITTDLFTAENGEEIDLMKYNREYWDNIEE